MIAVYLAVIKACIGLFGQAMRILERCVFASEGRQTAELMKLKLALKAERNRTESESESKRSRD